MQSTQSTHSYSHTLTHSHSHSTACSARHVLLCAVSFALDVVYGSPISLYIGKSAKHALIAIAYTYYLRCVHSAFSNCTRLGRRNSCERKAKDQAKERAKERPPEANEGVRPAQGVDSNQRQLLAIRCICRDELPVINFCRSCRNECAPVTESATHLAVFACNYLTCTSLTVAVGAVGCSPLPPVYLYEDTRTLPSTRCTFLSLGLVNKECCESSSTPIGEHRRRSGAIGSTDLSSKLIE